MPRGRHILREAVKRYPDYAPAPSLLAYVPILSASVGWSPAGRDDELAEDLANRALELDAEETWAYEALGLLATSRRQTDEAVRHYRTALDLNPNLASAHASLGWALVVGGRSCEALACFERARALRTSPRDIRGPPSILAAKRPPTIWLLGIPGHLNGHVLSAF